MKRKNLKQQCVLKAKEIDFKRVTTIKRYIFLLEDDREELARLKQIIEENLPIQIYPVYSADEAMRLIEDFFDRFVAFVLDIEIVGEKYTGIQIADKVRCHSGGSHVPIIFISSYAHFSAGALQRLHYHDFFAKPYDPEKLIRSLSDALETDLNSCDPKRVPPLFIEGNGATFKMDLSDVSSMELIGSTLVITDLNGVEVKYQVKPRTFSNICAFLQQVQHPTLRQVHRSVIINVDRIRNIKWLKNTAMVWLFQEKSWKPVGKTYMEQLAHYNK